MSNKIDEQYRRMLEDAFSVNPKEVDGINNLSYFFYREYIYQMIYSRFIFKGFPSSWDLDYFREVLFKEGIISVCETDVGVLALRGGYSGVNIYNKPTEMIISNPVLGSFTRKIGIDCMPVYFNYSNTEYPSMESIVKRYALLLAQIDASLNVTLINSRVAMAFTSSNKQVVTTAKKMYDKVSSGTPAVFAVLEEDKTGNGLTSQPFFNNVKNTYVGVDIYVTKQSILNELYTLIGIKNANTQKKERLVKDEVNSNNVATYTLIDLWKDNLQDCFNRVNDIFPNINVTVEIRREDDENELS